MLKIYSKYEVEMVPENKINTIFVFKNEWFEKSLL